MLEHRRLTLHVENCVLRVELAPKVRDGYGYVLVELLNDAEIWAAVATTPGVLSVERLNTED